MTKQIIGIFSAALLAFAIAAPAAYAQRNLDDNVRQYKRGGGDGGRAGKPRAGTPRKGNPGKARQRPPRNPAPGAGARARTKPKPRPGLRARRPGTPPRSNTIRVRPPGAQRRADRPRYRQAPPARRARRDRPRRYRPAPPFRRDYVRPPRHRRHYRRPPVYYYNLRLSCARVARMLRNRGYYDVEAFDCVGDEYGFYAMLSGRDYEVYVDAYSGAVVERFRY